VSHSARDEYRILNFRNFQISIGYGYAKFLGSRVEKSITAHLYVKGYKIPTDWASLRCRRA